MSAPPATSDASPRNRRWLVALPLIGFMAVAGLFLLRLYGGDPSKIPSALIGRPVPQTTLPALEGLVRNGAPDHAAGFELAQPRFLAAIVDRDPGDQDQHHGRCQRVGCHDEGGVGT